MSGVNLSDYKNDANEWTASPEQIRADMAWEPDPADAYDDFGYGGYEEDSDDYLDLEADVCSECETGFDCYTACECGQEGEWLGNGSDYVREDFGWAGMTE